MSPHEEKTYHWKNCPYCKKQLEIQVTKIGNPMYGYRVEVKILNTPPPQEPKEEVPKRD